MALFNDFNPFSRIATNQYGMVGKNVTRGSLVSFSYPRSWAMVPNEIHDPYPLLIITDVWPGFIRGVNLHYLTFPYIKNILQTNCNNTNYSYYSVKGDKYIANAFRMYYRQGMSKIKKMDCEFLLKMLSLVRSWSESEIDRVKDEIRKQIKQELQIKANQLKALELTASDNAQIRRKAQEMQQAIQGGVNRGLMNTPQQNVGKNPANMPMPPGGPFST